MRTIERSSAFKRDYKKLQASPKQQKNLVLLLKTLALLAEDHPLPESNRDHALSGDWFGYRECHIRPDLLLILTTQHYAWLD